jgi:transposase
MDTWEVIRRWHDNQSISRIAKVLGFDRKTIRGYIRFAQKHGISRDSPLPERERYVELLSEAEHVIGRAPQAQTILEAFLSEIVDLVNADENALKPKMAFEVLCERHQLVGLVSYTSFKRFVRAHKIVIHPKQSTCRMETAPASEVQIDYARIGILYDPYTKRKRTLYAFIATLSFSRHKFIELVFRQDQQSFVGSHVRMFDYFGCVFERIHLDNLKTGVIKPDLYDPTINHSYRELAEHYHCFLDPCRVAHPKDKGKVERDVQTVRQAVRKLIVLHPAADIVELNRLMRHWCIDDYGQRKHGTTHEEPYRVFTACELPAGKPLPPELFQVAEWKEVTVHPDHYIQFKKKSYSVPTSYIGKKVWVRSTGRILYIYHANVLVKQHLITDSYRHTDHKDFPENVRAALDSGIPKTLLVQAQRISPHFHSLIRSILEVHAFINLRKAQGLLSLAEQFDHALIDQASAFAIEHRLSVSPKQFRLLLEKMRAQQTPSPTISISQESLEFVRDMSYFISSQETATGTDTHNQQDAYIRSVYR